MSFLLQDKTDEVIYDFNTFVCVDFAEMVHNNAEAVGIKAAIVCIVFTDGGPGHALNAFETKDRGLVYIDCTAPLGGSLINADKKVDVEVNKLYIPISIFPTPGWSSTWSNMGTVSEIEIIRW